MVCADMVRLWRRNVVERARQKKHRQKWKASNRHAFKRFET